MKSLRILIGVDTYSPDVNGAARFAERLATGLARRGHDVHVVAASPSGPPGTEQWDGVTVHRVRSHRYPMHASIQITMPWEAGPATAALVEELDPDVVHVQAHFVVGRGLVNAAHRTGRPLIATNHFMPENLSAYVPVPRFLRRAVAAWAWRDLGRVFGKAGVVTAPTPRAVELLVAAGLPNAIPVSCGIDAERYHAAESGVPTVLFVGRLDQEKRVDELIRAFAALPVGLPGDLEIVGDGARRGDWSALAEELGLSERVRFRGFVTEEELVDTYARAAVFVMPGIAELQSMATLEAMAAGTPVVAAKAMALPHLVRPGHNGWLYPPGDVAELASGLAVLLAEPALRRQMGAASRTMATEHAIGTTLARFEGIYYREIDRARRVPLPTAA
ncbi:MAG: glycosyltransferase [Pseudonocardiales bacterium]|nr:glycosyltransferase [Pseudonocardiales bacterium]